MSDSVHIIDHPSVAHSTKTCVACPEQYEGQLVDGRWFYFRFRSGYASLGVGSTLGAAAMDELFGQWGPNRAFEDVAGDLDRLRGWFQDGAERDAVFARLLARKAEWAP